MIVGHGWIICVDYEQKHKHKPVLVGMWNKKSEGHVGGRPGTSFKGNWERVYTYEGLDGREYEW